MEPLRMQVQRKNGTWAEISKEHPIPTWIINPRQRTIGIENLHILVPHLEEISRLLPVSIKSVVDLAGEVGETLEGSHIDYVERLDEIRSLFGEMKSLFDETKSLVDRAGMFAKYFLIAQGVSVVLALTALVMGIIAVVR